MKLPRIRFSDPVFLGVGCTQIPTETIPLNPNLQEQAFNINILALAWQAERLASNLPLYFSGWESKDLTRGCNILFKYNLRPQQNLGSASGSRPVHGCCAGEKTNVGERGCD